MSGPYVSRSSSESQLLLSSAGCSFCRFSGLQRALGVGDLLGGAWACLNVFCTRAPLSSCTVVTWLLAKCVAAPVWAAECFTSAVAELISSTVLCGATPLDASSFAMASTRRFALHSIIFNNFPSDLVATPMAPVPWRAGIQQSSLFLASTLMSPSRWLAITAQVRASCLPLAVAAWVPASAVRSKPRQSVRILGVQIACIVTVASAQASAAEALSTHAGGTPPPQATRSPLLA